MLPNRFKAFLVVQATVALALGASAQVHNSSHLEVWGGGEQVGVSLEPGPDLYGDGIPELAVGVPDPSGSLNSGRVLILSGRSGSLSRVIENPGIGQGFGAAITWLGDLDKDGCPDLAVAAIDKDTALKSSTASGGSVVIVSGLTGRPLRQFGLKGSDRGLLYGFRLLTVDDHDGDGENDIAIAAVSNHVTSTDSRPRVEIHSSLSGDLLWEASGLAGSDFGQSLTLISDLNSDGLRELVVGTPSDIVDRAASPTICGGVLACLSGKEGHQLWAHFGGSRHSSFGSAITAIGDVNHDGATDLVVVESGPFAQHRGLYIISGKDGSAIGSIDGTAANFDLTAFVRSAGDMDGDGLTDFLVLRHDGASDRLCAYSGTSAPALLLSIHAPQTRGMSCAAIDDANRDGIADFVVAQPHIRLTDTQPLGGVLAVNGATGAVLWKQFGDR